MLYLSYRSVNKGFVRLSFDLKDKSKDGIILTGTILERPDPGTRDRYYSSFAGKFSWEVEANHPPFRLIINEKGFERDITYDLFYGIPQFLFKHVFDFVPQAVLKYKTSDYRSCSNCVYKTYLQNYWEEYQSRSTADRHETLGSLYWCNVKADGIDWHKPHDRHTFENAKRQLKTEVCEAHTRAAYQVDVSYNSRVPGDPATRWVSAEHRRLHFLNPEAIKYDSNTNIVCIAGNNILLCNNT